MWLFRKSKNKASSRTQIRIKEVKDGILILPNNEYRVVLETSSINFELKSDSEQDVLIDSFQDFLNSLPCPVQILIRVREVDIDRYLENITQSSSKETENVYKTQIKNYCEFIKNLVSGNKILSRKFYVVIPYKNGENFHDFNLIREQIRLSQDIVIKGLEKIGMKARQMDSIEVLELFYSFYNSGHDKIQELKVQTIEKVFNQNYAI